MSAISEMNTYVYYVSEVEMDIDIIDNAHSFLVSHCTAGYKDINFKSHCSLRDY